ncbi:MAG: DinB family protein, partial [Balneolaceae bacterium]
MKTSIRAVFIILFIACLPLTSAAQESGDRFSDQFTRHFDSASMRILSLAEAMPEEYYSWRPGEEVMSFAEVCMHITRYNYYYPVVTLGYPVPEGIDLDNLESVTGKETILEELERSIEYVRDVVGDIPEAGFNEPAQLYGREVTVQAVFMQLIT